MPWTQEGQWGTAVSCTKSALAHNSLGSFSQAQGVFFAPCAPGVTEKLGTPAEIRASHGLLGLFLRSQLRWMEWLPPTLQTGQMVVWVWLVRPSVTCYINALSHNIQNKYFVFGEVRILKFAHHWFVEIHVCCVHWSHTERQHDFLSSKSLLHLEYMQGIHWPCCVVNKTTLNKKYLFLLLSLIFKPDLQTEQVHLLFLFSVTINIQGLLWKYFPCALSSRYLL